MTPREHLQGFVYDSRIITGGYFPSDPLPVAAGDSVGVVLFNTGGPSKPSEVFSFLYNIFMDPALIRRPRSASVRHVVSRLLARQLAKSIKRQYKAIGGRSPINKLTGEQVRALEQTLNDRYGAAAGVTFRTYIATRYGHPSSEEAAKKMQADGVDKVMLLPLYPHYSASSSGSSLGYWSALQRTGIIPSWPTTYAFEYAAHPKYLQAISERIDQALQRFSRTVRDQVHLVFSAQGTPLREMKERLDPYCCLVHSTVHKVMALRGMDRPFTVAFQGKLGVVDWLYPETPETLERLAREGKRAVLIIPISYVAENLETVYHLDVKLREQAETLGILHYEVTAGLNCHPLFIETLAEVVMSQLSVEGRKGPMLFTGQTGAHEAPYALKPLGTRSLCNAELRNTRCPECTHIIEARCWKNDVPLPVDTPK